jgi:hypothetical protein
VARGGQFGGTPNWTRGTRVLQPAILAARAGGRAKSCQVVQGDADFRFSIADCVRLPQSSGHVL